MGVDQVELAELLPEGVGRLLHGCVGLKRLGDKAVVGDARRCDAVDVDALRRLFVLRAIAQQRRQHMELDPHVGERRREVHHMFAHPTHDVRRIFPCQHQNAHRVATSPFARVCDTSSDYNILVGGGQ